MTVDELVVKITTDTDGLSEGLRIALNKVKSFGKAVQTAIGATLLGLATAVVGAFSKSFSELRQEATVLGQLSEEVNASVEDLSAWSNAVEISGGSAKNFQSAITSLNKDFANFNITGKSNKTALFDALGLDMSSLSSKPIMSAMDDIIKSVEGMDKGKSRDILKKLGFDNESIKIIQSGKKNVDDLIQKQKEWGVITKKDSDAIKTMEKATKEISVALKTLFIPLFSKILSNAAKFTTYFLNMARWIRNNLDVVRKAVILLAVAISNKLVGAIKQIGLALKANKLMIIIAAIAMLLLVIEDLWVYANNGESALEGLWEKLGSPKEVMEGFERFGKAILGILDFVDSAEAKFMFWFVVLTKGIMVVSSLLTGLIAGFAGIPIAVAVAIAGAIAFIYTYWDELKAVAQTFVNMFIDFFRIGGVLHNTLSAFSKAFLEFFTNPIDKIIEALEKLKKWFIDNFGSLDAIMSRMSNFGASAQLAKSVAGGGTGDTTYNYDNSTNTLNFATPQSSARAIKEMGYSQQANKSQ